MDKFKVAAVQLNLSKDTPTIVESMQYYLRKAKREGVHIVCFPEDSLYEGPARNKRIIEVIREECRQLDIWCIITAHIRERKHTYNAALLIDNQGKIFGKHKKVHTCDWPNVHSGSTFDVHETPFCKIGIAICWDISSLPALHTMISHGAEVVFCPLYWCYEDWSHEKHHKKFEKKILQALVLARSFDNLIYTVFCNAYDPKERSLVPYSAIAEPHMIVKDIFNREGMITAEVDLVYLRELRKMYDKIYQKKITELPSST